MIAAASSFSWAGPQSLTFAIPVGTLVAYLLWGFFQRHQIR